MAGFVMALPGQFEVEGLTGVALTATAMEVFVDGPPAEFTEDDLEEMARIRGQRP